MILLAAFQDGLLISTKAVLIYVCKTANFHLLVPSPMQKLFRIETDYYPALQRTNTENSKQIFPEKELRGQSPNFHIHVSVSDLYVYSHNRSAYSAAGNMWTDPRNI